MTVLEAETAKLALRLARDMFDGGRDKPVAERQAALDQAFTLLQTQPMIVAKLQELYGEK